MVLCLYAVVILCIAVFGGEFVKFSVGGISVTYVIMGITLIYYFKYFCIDARENKELYYIEDKRFRIDAKAGAILALSLYGIIRMVLSYLNATDFLVSDRLIINKNYVFRQSYYLLFLPLLLLNSDKYSNVVKQFISKYRYFLFFIIYIANIILFKRPSLGVTTIFALAYLSLSKIERNPIDILMLILIVLSPVSTGGEMTNILLRIIFVTYYFSDEERINDVSKLYKYLSVLFIVLCFILPIFHVQLAKIFDSNSIWRLDYWYDEIKELKKSFFMGVGYGTSFASWDFVSGNTTSGPFAADSQYSISDKMFVVGSHNSIISTIFRLGIIGGLALLIYLYSIAKDLENISADDNLTKKPYYYLFYSSLIIISTNVGFESPYYYFIFLFSHLMCLSFLKRNELDSM